MHKIQNLNFILNVVKMYSKYRPNWLSSLLLHMIFVVLILMYCPYGNKVDMIWYLTLNKPLWHLNRNWSAFADTLAILHPLKPVVNISRQKLPSEQWRDFAFLFFFKCMKRYLYPYRNHKVASRSGTSFIIDRRLYSWSTVSFYSVYIIV